MQQNYNNPLDKYRTYSYQFVLTIANSTEVHRKMLDGDKQRPGSYLEKIGSTQLGNPIAVQGDRANSGNAYLLLDTRRYSQFGVTHFESTQTYGTGSVENPSVPLSFMKMKVVDSTGLSFFNFLMDITRNKIRSDRGSAFFMLTIFFVGHDDAGNTSTVSTCHIPMLLASLAFDFGHSGSTFDIEFMEVEGNPGASIPQMCDLGDVQSLSTEGRSPTIGGMLQALEDKLNLRSLSFYQKYTNVALADSDSATAGKLVQYMITVPDEWNLFDVDMAMKSKNVEKIYIAQSAAAKAQMAAAKQSALDSGATQAVAESKERAAYMGFSYTTDIPNAINMILESSEQYLSLADRTLHMIDKSGRSTGDRKVQVHKTVISVTSDNTSYIIHFDIYPYVAQSLKDTSTTKEVITPQTKNTSNSSEIKNLIYYDYLFTGRNSHIIDLKVEFSPHSAVALEKDIDLDSSRLQDTIGAGQKNKDVAKYSSGSTTKSVDFNPLIKPGEPIFIPTKTKDQQIAFGAQHTEEYSELQQKKKTRAKQEHTSTLAALHFMGSLSTQVTIRGNPNLFRKYADRKYRGGIAPHTLDLANDISKIIDGAPDKTDEIYTSIVKQKFSTAKQRYISEYVSPRIDAFISGSEDDPLMSGADIAVGPVYVKLNIRAPSVDFTGDYNVEDFLNNNSLFTNKFFYNGAYMMMNIQHIFENGGFTQVMTLFPYDIDGSFSKALGI